MSKEFFLAGMVRQRRGQTMLDGSVSPIHKPAMASATRWDPRLVLKLKGRAWEIASNIDHEQLESYGGTQYLLSFLKEKLGRLPIPDMGQHLDTLFVKTRRVPGTDMVTWCNQLREAYKKVQRSLARTRPGRVSVGTQTDELWRAPDGYAPTQASPPSTPQPGAKRRESGSEPHHEPSSGERVRSEGRDDPSPVHEEEWDEQDWWDEDAWWYGWDEWYGWDGAEQEWSQSDDREPRWEEDELLYQELIPEEVLGWLLLRRSGLPASSRLSIQASSNNSMRFHDIERSMRQQEDELLAQERSRLTAGPHRNPRSYWVEQSGQWGIYLVNFDETDITDDQIHWVDPHTWDEPWGQPEVLDRDQSSLALYGEDGVGWQWHEDDWHTQTSSGEWLAYSDVKPWLDIDDIGYQDPSVGKELQELYTTFDAKVRTFREARDAMYQKGKNRGFFNNKGVGKGKGSKKGKVGGSKPVFALQSSSPAKGKGNLTNPASRPGFSGCFICGAKDHSFRDCPKRSATGGSGTSSSTRAAAHLIAMVEDAAEPTSPKCLQPQDIQRLILAASITSRSH